MTALLPKTAPFAPEQIEAAITPKTVLFMFSSPCNPSGAVYTRDELEAMGYPLAEILDALGTGLNTVTLRQVLQFAARRRRKVRYDSQTDSIVDDGAVQPVTPIALVDAEVSDA